MENENNSIEWQIESSSSETSRISPDGRWHLTEKVARDGKRQLSLYNNEILLSPSGYGKIEKECWLDYIASCDKYLEKLAKIRNEAIEKLKKLEE